MSPVSVSGYFFYRTGTFNNLSGARTNHPGDVLTGHNQVMMNYEDRTNFLL